MDPTDSLGKQIQTNHMTGFLPPMKVTVGYNIIIDLYYEKSPNINNI